MEMIISERQLDELRAKISNGMSSKRLNHTLEVEKMAVRLGELYLPDKINVLRAAALLHDITKEYLEGEHLRVFEKYGVELSEEDMLASKTFHARSAALIIESEYPSFACDDVISAVRWHTTGRAGMSVCDKLIYLADYIDMSRNFEDCVKLRDYFFGAEPEKMSEEDRLLHLDRTLIISFNMTMDGLLRKSAVISRDTVSARNDLICAVTAKSKK